MAYTVDEQQWVGFVKVTAADIDQSPSDYVKYYVITLVLLLLQRLSIQWKRRVFQGESIAIVALIMKLMSYRIS